MALAEMVGMVGVLALRCYWDSRWVPGVMVPGHLGSCQGRGRCHLRRPTVDTGIRAGAVHPPAQHPWHCRELWSPLAAKGWQQWGLPEGWQGGAYPSPLPQQWR